MQITCARIGKRLDLRRFSTVAPPLFKTYPYGSGILLSEES